MSAKQQMKRASAGASKWPDVRHKYRNLAIPAVVAAILPEKRGPWQPAAKTDAERAADRYRRQ